MSDMSQLPGYLTAYEAADRIGVSHSQITRYVSNGQLPSMRVGNVILIPESSVQHFIRPPVGNPEFRKKKKLAT